MGDTPHRVERLIIALKKAKIKIDSYHTIGTITSNIPFNKKYNWKKCELTLIPEKGGAYIDETKYTFRDPVNELIIGSENDITIEKWLLGDIWRIEIKENSSLKLIDSFSFKDDEKLFIKGSILNKGKLIFDTKNFDVESILCEDNINKSINWTRA